MTEPRPLAYVTDDQIVAKLRLLEGALLDQEAQLSFVRRQLAELAAALERDVGEIRHVPEGS